MITLVWRTDVHMADKGPSSRTDEWVDTVLNKLGQVRDVARREEASAILDGGDFFHIKSPTRNSHEVIRRVADHHRNYPCPVYCTPGNHDSVYGDYNFIGQQPLGVLFSTGVFNRLYDEHELFITKWGVYPYNRKTDTWPNGHPPEDELERTEEPVVRVVGIPYHGSKYEMERFHSIKKGLIEDYIVVVAHVLASEKGGKMFEGEDIVQYADLIDAPPDVWCFGHWHKDQGVTVLDEKHFVNVGSLTRGSLSQDEVQRRPACVVLRFCSKTGLSTETVRLDVGVPEEVFDLEGRARQVRQQVEMDVFVEKIRAGLQPRKEGETLTEAVSGVDGVPDDVRSRAQAYLEKVD